MKRLSLAAITMLSILVAAPTTRAADLPFYLTSTPTLVLPALTQGRRTWLHLELPNFQSTAWCSSSLSKVDQPATPANPASLSLALPDRPPLTPAAAGAFIVEGGAPVNYHADQMPSGDLWCVAQNWNVGDPPIPFTVQVIQSGY